MKKIFKWLLTIVIVLFILVSTLGSVAMFNISLATKVEPTDKQDSYEYLFKRDYLKQWVDSLNNCKALCDTIIIAPDGAKLHGLYVRAANESPKTTLIIHGYTDNAIRMLMIGHIYNKEMGYNILLPDLRAHGESEGEYIQMGWKDRLDVLQWIDVAKELYGDTTRMVMHGISMGAATTMMASGENLPDNIKCFVEDCGYTSVWDEFSHKLKDEFSLPEFPLMYTTSMYCDMHEGWNFKEASALEQVKKCKQPMFFIHGDTDTYVPTWMVHELYKAKDGEKELWVAPDTEHALAYWNHTEEYVKRIKKFVSNYIDK